VLRLSVAGLDSGAESPVYGGEPSASAGREPGGGPPWAPPMRSVPLSAIQFYETPSSGNGAGNDTTASGFPVIHGEAFSMRFGQVYLNYNPSAAVQRAEQLAAFISEDVRDKDPQFGWNGNGTSVTQSTEVARIDVRSADTAAATLPTGVNGQPMELGVPRYASDGRLIASGRPAWLPAPPVVALPSARQANSGQTAQSALASQLPGFSQALADGDQAALARYLAPGASINGPGGATRDTTATADRTIPDQVGPGSPTLVTSYDMSVIDQQSGRWYVRDIRASTQPMGTP
jgi:Conjugative transposon protein TcpC